MRSKYESISDDVTMALGREDVLPGVAQDRTPTLLPHAPAIPHFRAKPPPDPPTIVARPPPEEDAKRGAPWSVWIFASVIAGMLSYHVVPAVVGLFQTRPQQHAQVQSLDP